MPMTRSASNGTPPGRGSSTTECGRGEATGVEPEGAAGTANLREGGVGMSGGASRREGGAVGGGTSTTGNAGWDEGVQPSALPISASHCGGADDRSEEDQASCHTLLTSEVLLCNLPNLRASPFLLFEALGRPHATHGQIPLVQIETGLHACRHFRVHFCGGLWTGEAWPIGSSSCGSGGSMPPAT